MICLETVVEGVEDLVFGVLESEMVESLPGLADLLADFYMVSQEQEVGIYRTSRYPESHFQGIPFL